MRIVLPWRRSPRRVLVPKTGDRPAPSRLGLDRCGEPLYVDAPVAEDMLRLLIGNRSSAARLLHVGPKG